MDNKDAGLMWLKESLRLHGYSHRLMMLDKDKVQNRSHRVFGERNDFPKGQQRNFMTKEL